MSKKCIGLLGAIYGHNYKEIIEETHLPFDENVQAAIRAVGSAHPMDRDKIIKDIIKGRTNKLITGIYCTRCGFGDPANR